MELIILGKNTKSKGAELERFCRRLFIKLGFKNSTLNFIAAGGNEYDVTAEKIIQQEDGTEVSIPIIAECKAYNKPCEMTHWLKFLGKFHTAQLNNKLAEGYFVALCGVNGNVWGAATPLISTESNIQIIAKDDLIKYVVKEYNLSPIEHIRRIGELYSNRVVDTVDFILYDNQIYWLLRFNSKDFTIIKNDETPLTSKELKKSLPKLSKKSFFNYIDLIEERETQLKISSLRGFILYCALCNCGNCKAEIESTLSKTKMNFTFHDVVSVLKDTKYVSDSLPIKIIQPSSYIAFFRYLFSNLFFPSSIISNDYQTLVNQSFLNEVLLMQGNLVLDTENQEKALFILRCSPSAICNVIYEDTMLVNASRNSILFKSKYHKKFIKNVKLNFLSY